MNAITSIYLDVVRQGPVKQRITAKQGDVGTRYITVSLTANGKMLTIPQDVKAVLVCEREGFAYGEHFGSVKDNKIEIEIPPELLNKSGIVACEVKISRIKTGEILTSADFELFIVPSIAVGKPINNEYRFDHNAAISPFAHNLGTNNLAGARAFTITALDPIAKTYTLDSVEGLAIGDVYSIHLYNQWENAGKIIAINTATNTVTVDKHYGTELNTTSVAIEKNGFDNEKNTFRIITKPYVGTRKIGCGSVNLGYFGKTLSKGALTSGFKNTSYGSYSVTLGAENEAGYCGFAQGACHKIKGFWSAAFGKRNTVNGEASFGAGEGLIVAGNRQSVFGTYNIPDSEAIVIIGNGTADNARSNALVVKKNGEIFINGNPIISAEALAEELSSYVGSYALTPYINGVSVAFSVNLDYPVQYDGFRIWANGVDVSGKIPKDNEFITAPIIFEAEDILVTLEREDTVVLALKMSELRSVNGVVFGKLGIKEDENEE